MGAQRDADRPGDRRRPLPSRAPRPGSGRHSRAAAGRRLPDLRAGRPRGRRRQRAPAPRGPPAPRASTSMAALERLLDSPNLASKRWVYEQYDSTVQASTVLGPGGDAGGAAGARQGVRRGRDRGLQQSRWWRSTRTRAARRPSPRRPGTSPAPGAVPLGITDCLNFGNPEKPEVFFQFREACRGIADACRAFDTPVTGGNVSFYNESPTGAVDPTPTVGMVGLLDKVADRVPATSRTRATRSSSSARPGGELGGSAYWAEVLDFIGGRARAGGSRCRSAGSSGCWWPRPGSACSARRTMLRGRPGRGAGGSRHGRAVRPAGLGAPVDLTGYARGCPRKVCCTARTARARSSSAAPAELDTPRGARPRARRAGRSGRAGSASAAAPWNSEWGRRCSSGPSAACAGPILQRSRAGCSIRTWIARRECKACAASSASPGSLTRPGSPTSACTRCSIAARRAPAS